MGNLLLPQTSTSSWTVLAAKSLWFSVVSALKFKFSGAPHHGSHPSSKWCPSCMEIEQLWTHARYASTRKVIGGPFQLPMQTMISKSIVSLNKAHKAFYFPLWPHALKLQKYITVWTCIYARYPFFLEYSLSYVSPPDFSLLEILPCPLSEEKLGKAF